MIAGLALDHDLADLLRFDLHDGLLPDPGRIRCPVTRR